MTADPAIRIARLAISAGDFPGHHPDPTVATNLVQLQHAVRYHGCDSASPSMATATASASSTDLAASSGALIALFARDILKQRPGSTIIADVKASETLFDDILRHAGTPLIWQSR